MNEMKSYFTMERYCTKYAEVYICQNFRFELTNHHQWQRMIRGIQHKKWQHSGITQHYENCQHAFDKKNFEPIHNMQGETRRKLAYDTKIREALEIRRHGCGPGKGLNEDMGAYIKTDIWDPVLSSL